jgi:malonate decarboxylase beta subunit
VHSPRPTTPHAWLRALADDSAFDEHDAHVPSPHLARFGIAPRGDDGIVAATVSIGGRVFEAVAQDAQFLRGSVGERHGAKLATAIARARSSRRPLLVLAASGGVRLHEANAGELALARALRALVDARAEGIATLAIGIGDVFGGMSVLVSACDALALLPGTRLGLSGPQVIALAQDEAAPADAHEHRASADVVCGAEARVRAGFADELDDDVQAMRAWIGRHLAPPAFAASVQAMQARLASATGAAAANVAVTRDGACATLAAFARRVDAASLVGVDAALLRLPHRVRRLLIVEDSRGHEASIAAERIGVSRYFAHHACVLGLLRARGVELVGVVVGVGHSAAFFANALQADRVYALPGSRVIAMEPRALARVTGMDAAMLTRAIDEDPLLGHPARHLAALGGLTLVETIDAAR